GAHDHPARDGRVQKVPRGHRGTVDRGLAGRLRRLVGDRRRESRLRHPRRLPRRLQRPPGRRSGGPERPQSRAGVPNARGPTQVRTLRRAPRRATHAPAGTQTARTEAQAHAMTDAEIARQVTRRLAAQLKEATRLERLAWEAFVKGNRYFGPAEKEWTRAAAALLAAQVALKPAPPAPKRKR